MTKQQPIPKWKWALAGLGAVFCVAAAAGVIVMAVTAEKHEPSELALNPERQDEIITERKAREYQQKLELTEEQTLEVQQILLEARKERKESLGNPGGDLRARMSSRIGAMMSLDQKVQAILTPEQQAKLGAMKQERRSRMAPLRGMFQERHPDMHRKIREEAKKAGAPVPEEGN